MKTLRDWVLIGSLFVQGAAWAQSAQETSGVQAASLALIDDALQQFESGNIEESVKDLRSSAAILRIEGKGYTVREAALMEAGALAAERLATSISDKSISTKEKFRYAAAEVALLKANAHYSAALRNWADVQRIRTAEQVIALSHGLKHSFMWANGRISETQAAVLARASATSEKMLQNNVLPSAEITSVIAALGDELQAMNKATKRIF